MDVSHSEDEEAEGTEDAAAGLSKEERQEKAKAVSHSRILTQDDFKKIRMHQLSKQLALDPKHKAGKKRKSDTPTQLVELSEPR